MNQTGGAFGSDMIERKDLNMWGAGRVQHRAGKYISPEKS